MRLQGSKMPTQMLKSAACLIFLTVLLSSWGLMASGPAMAASSPATSLTININNNGVISTVKTYSMDELKSMEQTRLVYSSLDSMPAGKYVSAEGLMLTDLLTRAGIDVSSISTFKFNSTDNYPLTMSRASLLDTPRYYYPNLYMGYVVNGTTTSFSSEVAGIIDGAEQIQPMLAVNSYTERWNTGAQWDKIDGTCALRLCLGQATVDEQNAGKFAKYVNQIEVDGKLLPPALTADSTDNTVGQPVTLTFSDDEAWRTAITDVTIDENSIAGHYSAAAGTLIIEEGVFSSAGDYTIVVKANGYGDSTVSLHVSSGYVVGKYTVAVVADTSYQDNTEVGGIATMTVNSSVSGLQYFSVQITPVIVHTGMECVVFVHLRNGIQDSLNVTKADFDAINIAVAGFNVQAGDVVRAYIVDNLSNSSASNSVILQ